MPKARVDATAATDAADAGAVNESSSVPSPVPAPVAPTPFVVARVEIVSGRGLFSVVDNGDDATAAGRKKAGKAPNTGAPGNNSTSEPPKTSNGKGGANGAAGSSTTGANGATSSSAKKKKGSKDDDEPPHVPFHCFLTYAPFEPILVEPASTPFPLAAAVPAKDRRSHARNMHDDEPTGPPPPQYQTTIQTPVTEDSLAPQVNFAHTQTLVNREHFLDTLHTGPLLLHVWQYCPLGLDGKKKPAKGSAGAVAGSGAPGSQTPGSPPGTAGTLASRKKKAGARGSRSTADEDDADTRPFGDIDPECVAKVGEVRVDLETLLQGATSFEAWLPIHLANASAASSASADETNNATTITASTSRVASLTSRFQQAAAVQQRAEFLVRIELDRPVVDGDEVAFSNRLSVEVERLERLPNWILDAAYLEAVENANKRIAEESAAAAAAAAGNGTGSRPGSVMDNHDSATVSALTLPAHARMPSRDRFSKRSTGPSRGDRGGADGALTGLEAFTPPDHADTFSLTFNLPLSAQDLSRARTVRLNDLQPALGWSEAQRQEARIEDAWVPPRREVVVEEMPQSAKKKSGGTSGAGASSATSTGTSAGPRASPNSGRSTPHGLEGLASGGVVPEFAEPLPFNPSTPRASLLVNNSSSSTNNSTTTTTAAAAAAPRTSAYLTREATVGLKSSISNGRPLLFQFEHVRTPLEEKLVEAGKIIQHALALVDLRALLKPGATTMTACFALRQTSAPLPARAPDEGKKKRGGGAGGGSGSTSSSNGGGGGSGSANKRGTGTGALDVGADAVPTPPETFDEARTFLKLTVRLARPLVPRRTPLAVADVLPTATTTNKSIVAASATRESPIADSFLSTAAGVASVRPAETLLPPARILSPPPPHVTGAADAAVVATILSRGGGAEVGGGASESDLNAFRATVREVVVRLASEYTSGVASGVISTTSVAPSSSFGSGHALPHSEVDSVVSSLDHSLASSGLSRAFLGVLRPALSRVIESRFTTPVLNSNATTPAATHPRHRQNELYAELSRVVREVVQEVVVSGGDQQQSLASTVAPQQSARARFEEIGALASYAERHEDLALASLHHTSRLAELTCVFDSVKQEFFSVSREAAEGFTKLDLVRAWHEYACFLLRRQNGRRDLELDAETSAGVFGAGENTDEHGVVRAFTPGSRVGKTGSVDGGITAAIDVAEEALQQCLRYEPGFTPALIGLALIHLEQDAVETSLAYVHAAVSREPRHAVTLALQGLYHSLAEEDAESLGAYHRASESLRDTVVDPDATSASGRDGLVHALLGEHARGAYSLPILHSQTPHLLLARILASLGFRRLTARLLLDQTREADERIAREDAEDEALASGSSDDASALPERRFDYAAFGAHLELAAWYGASPPLYASHTLPTLRTARRVLERGTVDAHHVHTLLYAFALQGDIHRANKAHDDAAAEYAAYLALLEEKEMNIFLDPLILCHASSLYLLRQVRSESLRLASTLVTHPFHTRDPFLWSVFGAALSGSGFESRADEAFAESLAKDVFSSRAWAGLTANHLRRLQREARLLRRRTNAAESDSPLPDSAFLEASHAFRRALGSPAPLQDLDLLVELARLWAHHDRATEAESCYARALLVAESSLASDGGNDAGRALVKHLNEKVRWLRHARDGTKPERETRAATAIQAVLKGALARKHATKQRRQRQIADIVKQRSRAELREEKVQEE